MAEISSPAWRNATRERVVGHVREVLARSAVTGAQRQLLETALAEMRACTAPEDSLVTSVHLPLLTAAAIRGEQSDDFRCAAVCALLETGFDLLDHMADRELGAHWSGVNPGVIHLVATGFLCALPQLVISRLPLGPAGIVALHDCLAEQLVRIGAGQQADLELNAADRPGSDAVLASVAGKTGERRALYARLAAIYAEADDAQCAQFARFGRELGIALQLASDLGDLYAEGPSRDLANATRTWPIALQLEWLDGEEKSAFLALLDRAGKSPAARRDVRQRLLGSAVVLRSVLEIELHKERAVGALQAAAADTPARRCLVEWTGAICRSDPPRSAPHDALA